MCTEKSEMNLRNSNSKENISYLQRVSISNRTTPNIFQKNNTKNKETRRLRYTGGNLI